MYGIRVNGRDVSSKKALKEAFASNPASVEFYNTSMFGGSDYDGTNVIDGLTFVGPNTYTKRSFYGSVSNKNGKITIK